MFYSDSLESLSISWDQLISDLKEFNSFNPYCFENSYYKIFLRIIFSMLSGKNITLLDADLSLQEVFALTSHGDLTSFEESVSKIQLPSSKKDLIQLLRNTPESWEITLFTSGTTGKPKSVSHTFKSISKGLKLKEPNKLDIWGYSYLPTHMAGIQVFLQALLNGDSIVRLMGLSKTQLIRSIEKNQVTHISATPTFYRLLIPIDSEIKSVTKITSGGEKFDLSLKNEIKKAFPNASFTNVYASTEIGALFASKGENFEIKESLNELIKIRNNELLVHQSLLGKSLQNDEKWYNTGDLVEIISEAPLTIKFKSRKSDLINIGGFKVNVLEVEDALLEIPMVKQARVFAKSNSVIGNILCCEISTLDEISEVEIRKRLSLSLQETKIPRIIKFVDEISTTATGKIQRKVA